jgi:hypothetical protein
MTTSYRGYTPRNLPSGAAGTFGSLRLLGLTEAAALRQAVDDHNLVDPAELDAILARTYGRRPTDRWADLTESATAVAGRTVSLLERAAPSGLRERTGPGRFRICIIQAGQGSSGVYPEETLRRDGPQIMKRGVHLYADHPSSFEDQDRARVGRPIRDLVGTLATDAVYRDGGLYAEASVFSQWRPVIEELAPHIGVSIRATGERDANGNITRLVSCESIDFVTRAGAGGRVLGLIESARGTAPRLAEPVTVSEAALDTILAATFGRPQRITGGA